MALSPISLAVSVLIIFAIEASTIGSPPSSINLAQ